MYAIQAILFSRNRAMQLDAVLRSFYLHCTDADTIDFRVLYLATDDRHKKQYALLAAGYPNVKFFPQEEFRQDLLKMTFQSGSHRNPWKFVSPGPDPHSLFGKMWKWMVRSIQVRLIQILLRKNLADKYVLFLVDDNLFVRDFFMQEVLATLFETPGLIGFSLRLGTNTTFCYPFSQAQRLPDFISLGNDLLQFYWPSSEFDFGYPLELSSSIYRLSDIWPLLAALRYNNPNDLEEQMAANVNILKNRHPLLGCFKKSVTFCNPVNKAQSHFPNRAGEDHAYTIEELADRFEAGERINTIAFTDFVPNGCHQETELIFERIGPLR